MKRIFSTLIFLAILGSPFLVHAQSEPAYFSFIQVYAGSGGDDFDGLTRAPQEFVFALTDPKKIRQARSIIAGNETGETHVAGTIVKGYTDYNENWPIYLKPDTIEFFHSSVEACDAHLREIVLNLDKIGGSFLPKKHWCPYTSRLVREIKNSKFPLALTSSK